MILRFDVSNYKALRDVSVQLTPLHVLIGPNDSGKTSILDAMFALCRSVDVPLPAAFRGQWSGRELVWQQEEQAIVGFGVEGSAGPLPVRYQLQVQFLSSGRHAYSCAERIEVGQSEPSHQNRQSAETVISEQQRSGFADLRPQGVTEKKAVYDLLSGVQIYRWNPRFLCLPNAPDAKRRFRMEPSGFGLALCLDHILGYDRKLYDKLESRFTSLFPEVDVIRLQPEPAFLAAADDSVEVPELRRAEGKGIYFQMRGASPGEAGPLIPASQASDGMLLVLAYLTVLNLPQPPRLLLIEEPENGIHPGRLREVLSILRDLIQSQSHTQVVMSTHSPYVLDLFQPDEVTLCYKRVDGAVQTQRLSESRAVREQIDVFTLGEIWTGDGDERLLEPAGVDQGAGE